ncbi:MAG TPA: hypothetical protein VFC18_14470 [Burkholderiales bacterium]|nr:hypothetical protein [Burkholderiales bacterium]
MLEANGQVRGTEVTVSAKAGGVLEVVAVREGTQVAKACMCRSQSGAPLMELALGIILKGVGIDVLWPQLAGLAAVGTALMRAALARLRRHLYV